MNFWRAKGNALWFIRKKWRPWQLEASRAVALRIQHCSFLLPYIIEASLFTLLFLNWAAHIRWRRQWQVATYKSNYCPQMMFVANLNKEKKHKDMTFVQNKWELIGFLTTKRHLKGCCCVWNHNRLTIDERQKMNLYFSCFPLALATGLSKEACQP